MFVAKITEYMWSQIACDFFFFFFCFFIISLKLQIQTSPFRLYIP